MLTEGQTVFSQRLAVAGQTVLGDAVGQGAGGKIDVALARLQNVPGQFIGCPDVVVVHMIAVKAFTGTDQGKGEIGFAQIAEIGVIFPGPHQDQSIHLAAPDEGLDDIEFFLVFRIGGKEDVIIKSGSGHDDAAQRFGEKGVEQDIRLPGRHDDADDPGPGPRQGPGDGIGMILQGLHFLQHPVPGHLGDPGIVGDDAGYGGR